MAIYAHSGVLQTHQYVWIEPNAIGQHDWMQAVWFGMTCYPGRAFGCHVILECGAVYRNVPLHQIAWRKTEDAWDATLAQRWNAYGYEFSVIEYPYLVGLNGMARCDDQDFVGRYLFTLIPIGDAYSATPTQAKEFYFMELANGRYTAQPTNYVLIQDRSFTNKIEWPTFLHRQTQWYSSEE